MPQVNFYWLFITAAFPLVIGYLYYKPSVFGEALRSATDETIKKRSPIMKYGLTYLFGLFMSYIIFLFAVHQSSVYQLFLHESDLLQSGTELNTYVTEFMDRFGARHRTFGHGVIHGVEITLLMGLGMLGVSTLYEGRPMKYLWIHLFYWLICGALMGGALCAWM